MQQTLKKERLAVGGSPKKKTPPNADDVPRWLCKVSARAASQDYATAAATLLLVDRQ